MHTDALLAAPVLLALVLLVSGIAKLRAGAADEDAFVSLRLPARPPPPCVHTTVGNGPVVPSGVQTSSSASGTSSR